MNPLRIAVTKLHQGDSLLKCTRADGSITCQRNDPRRASFFALHDLRHYAVESVLKVDKGFYGLIAAGWDIADTTGKTDRGTLPDETLWIEHLVGMLDADQTNANGASATDLNQYAAEFASRNQLRISRQITEDQLRRIRNLTAALHSRWIDLRAGATVQLLFPPEG